MSEPTLGWPDISLAEMSEAVEWAAAKAAHGPWWRELSAAAAYLRELQRAQTAATVRAMGDRP